MELVQRLHARNKMGFIAACIFFSAALVALIFLTRSSTEIAIDQKNGEIHLNNWDFSAKGAFTLDHGWEIVSQDRTATRSFHRGDRLEVTANAIASNGQPPMLRLTLRLPNSGSDHRWAMTTGAFTGHFKLFANERLVFDSRVDTGGWPGDPGYTSISTLALPSAVDGGELRLLVTFDKTAKTSLDMDTAPTIGSYDDIIFRRSLLSVALLVLVGSMLFATAYHLVVFAITKDSLANLAFAAFAALFGMRTLVIEPIALHTVPYLGPDLLWRVNFGLTILIAPACYWFFALSFPKYMSRNLGVGLSVVCLTFSLICAFGSYDAGQLCLQIFQILTLGLILIILQAVVRVAWTGQQGGSLALIGWMCSALPTIHDIMVDMKLINGANLLPFGFLAFFLCLSGILASRIHAAYRRNEQLAADLKLLNETLESRISARTHELSERLVELESNRAALETARETAVSANQAKSRFLANMSHELRTPLNAIMGFSEIIRDRIFGEGGVAKYSEYASHIHRSGGHLLRLINDILDLSKIEAGKFELRLKDCDLVDEVEAALRVLSIQADRKGVALIQNSHVNAIMRLDQLAFQQIMLNLLSNAVKFTPTGGVVTIDLNRLETGAIQIRVSDTGMGIPPQDIDRVLESFGQASHDVTTREERGTGLGLPIAKGLVEAHSGMLTLESRLGHGTTVTISFSGRNVISLVESPGPVTRLTG